MRQNGGNAIGNHCARRDDIFNATGRPPTTNARQSAPRAAALIDGPLVVIDCGSQSSLSPFRKHAAPAVARDFRLFDSTIRAASLSPMASTWSRQGAIAVIPFARQASTAPAKPYCWRMVARLMERPFMCTSTPRCYEIPPTVMTLPARFAASSGSRNTRAASARRNNSARCCSERALCWPPIM